MSHDYYLTGFDITIYDENDNPTNNYYEARNIATPERRYHYFNLPVQAKKVRLWPISYNGQSNIQWALILAAGNVLNQQNKQNIKIIKEPNLDISKHLIGKWVDKDADNIGNKQALYLSLIHI